MPQREAPRSPSTAQNQQYQEFISLGGVQPEFLETGDACSENESVGQGIDNTGLFAESEDSKEKELPWSSRGLSLFIATDITFT